MNSIMFDYDVLYNGKVIGNVKAETDEEALELAAMKYTQPVTIRRKDYDKNLR